MPSIMVAEGMCRLRPLSNILCDPTLGRDTGHHRSSCSLSKGVSVKALCQITRGVRSRAAFRGNGCRDRLSGSVGDK
ncbi:hypothetical protein RSAG8_05498, partial [Rhizoctonia solani AG-8 WAC10335]